jgi:hypothetical protein
MTARESTPKPWPENAWPTADQLADWLPIATRAERVELAAVFLRNSERSQDCFLRNHDALEDEASHLRAKATRYRLAWLSARRWRVAMRHVPRGADS